MQVYLISDSKDLESICSILPKICEKKRRQSCVVDAWFARSTKVVMAWLVSAMAELSMAWPMLLGAQLGLSLPESILALKYR